MLILLCLWLAACAESTTAPPRVLTVQEKDVARANTAFGLALLKEVDRTEASGNLLLSPLSVSMALGMTLNGAVGPTWEEMRRTLAFAATSQAEINSAYHGLIGQLRARDSKVEFGLANSIWYDTGFPVLPAFIDTVGRFFDAEVRQLDFRSAAAPGIISQWAADETNGRIKDLIKVIRPDEIMFLVNAVYFKAPWTRVFGAAHSAPFTRVDGSTVSAQIMSGETAFQSVVREGVQAVELAYADTAFSMVLISAEHGTSLAPALALLEPSAWTDLMAALQPGRVLVRMPKFKFTYEQTLNNTLKALGMQIPFDEGRADFSRIADVAPQRLFISRVQHKTFIDVHEKGTEAAAATAVGVGVTSMPPTISFDRPFLFVIRDRASGTLLFVGRILDPTAS